MRPQPRPIALGWKPRRPKSAHFASYLCMEKYQTGTSKNNVPMTTIRLGSIGRSANWANAPRRLRTTIQEIDRTSAQITSLAVHGGSLTVLKLFSMGEIVPCIERREKLAAVIKQKGRSNPTWLYASSHSSGVIKIP